MMRQRSPARRPGVSLVELLVVMSTAMVILTTSATLIHRLLHVQSRAYAFFAVERSAFRLASQFRRDVHQATEASIRGAGAEAVLRLPAAAGGSTEYRLTDGEVLRVASSAGGPAAREAFRFPAGTEWLLQERSDPRRLVLTLAPRPAGNAGTAGRGFSARFTIPVRFRVEACVGRDRYSIRTAAETEKQP